MASFFCSVCNRTGISVPAGTARCPHCGGALQEHTPRLDTPVSLMGATVELPENFSLDAEPSVAAQPDSSGRTMAGARFDEDFSAGSPPVAAHLGTMQLPDEGLPVSSGGQTMEIPLPQSPKSPLPRGDVGRTVEMPEPLSIDDDFSLGGPPAPGGMAAGRVGGDVSQTVESVEFDSPAPAVSATVASVDFDTSPPPSQHQDKNDKTFVIDEPDETDFDEPPAKGGAAGTVELEEPAVIGGGASSAAPISNRTLVIDEIQELDQVVAGATSAAMAGRTFVLGDAVVNKIVRDTLAIDLPSRADATLALDGALPPEDFATPAQATVALEAPPPTAPPAPAPRGAAGTIPEVRGGVSRRAPGLVVKTRSLRKPQDQYAKEGDYELLKVLGEGGMGVVYTARQSSIHRTVAVKMIKPGGKVDEIQKQKFLAEAVVTGDLEHPNIVPIYDLGTNEQGALFYSMKKVQGTPWDKTIRQRSLAENLEALMKVADAIAFAHSKKVIHRDLKPENVMLGEFGEVMVMDWGLAISVAKLTEAGLRQPVNMGGTPAYMAPEMVTGPFDRIGPASDVYLLGAILFEILEGEAPHTGATPMKCLHAAARNEIRPAKKTGELLDIALRAMATQPEARFPAVRDFQSAIREYQSHAESILLSTRAEDDLRAAREQNAYERYSRAVFGFQEAIVLWGGNIRAKKLLGEAQHDYARCALARGDFELGLSVLDAQEDSHRTAREELLSAQQERESRQHRLKTLRRVAVIGTVVFVSIIVVSLFWIKAERDRAEESRQIAEQQKVVAEEQKVIAEEQRQVAETQRQAAEAQKRLAEQRREEAEVAQREEAKAREKEQAARTLAEKRRQDAEAATLLAEERRAQAELARKQEAEARSKEEAARTLAEKRRKEAEESKLLAEKRRAEAEQAQKQEAAARMQEAEARTLAEKRRKQAEVAQQQEQVARGVAEQRRKEAESAQMLAEQRRAQAELARREEAAARLKEAEARRLEEIARRKAVEAQEREEYESYIAQIGLAAAKIEENEFGSARELLDHCKPSLRNWEWGRLRHLCQQGQTFDAPAPLDVVACARAGKFFVVGGWNGTAQLWELGRSQPTLTLPIGSKVSVNGVALSPDGTQIAVVSSDRQNWITLWNAATGEKIPRTFQGHSDDVLSVEFSRDGSKLLTSSYDKTARVWETATGHELAVLRGHTWWVWQASFSPDSRQIVTASQDGTALVWTDATAAWSQQDRIRRSPPFTGHQGAVYAAAFSPEGTTVVTGGYDKRVLLWKTADLRPLNFKALAAQQSPIPDAKFVALDGHTAAVRSVSFSPDGKLVLSGAHDNAVRAWDASRGKPVMTFRGHNSWVRGARFSADGDHIVSVGYDQKVKVWSVASYGEERVLRGYVLQGHADAVLAASFSPDEKLVVTASRDNTARTWDFNSAKELHSYQEGHLFLVSRAVFSRDVRQLFTSAIDNTVRQWDLSTGTQLRSFEHTGRSAVLAVSPDGRWLVTGSDHRSALLWNLREHSSPHELVGHRGEVTAMAFHSGGEQFVTGDTEGRCIVWNVRDKQPVAKFGGHTRRITALAYIDGDQRILSASGDNTVANWSASTGKEDPRRILKHPDEVLDLAVTLSGQGVATLCKDRHVRLWNLSDAARPELLDGVDAEVNSLAATADGKRLLTVSSQSRTARLWDVNSRKEIIRGKSGSPFLVSSAKNTALWSAVFSSDGQSLATVGGREAHLWDVRTARPLMSFSPHGTVASATFSPDGQRLVTGFWDSSARIWPLNSRLPGVKLHGSHTANVNSACFSPNGQFVLTASDDKMARLWDGTTGREVRAFVGHQDRVRSAVFSPDGAKILTASGDKTAQLWDASTGQLLREFAGHRGGVLSAVFSLNGQRILTGSEDHSAKLWETNSGRLLWSLEGHTAAVASVAISPDGTRLLTGSRDFLTKLWDADSRKEILTLKGHTQEVTSVAFSPSGRYVLTGSRDGTAIIWLTKNWKEPVSSKTAIRATQPVLLPMTAQHR